MINLRLGMLVILFIASFSLVSATRAEDLSKKAELGKKEELAKEEKTGVISHNGILSPVAAHVSLKANEDTSTAAVLDKFDENSLVNYVDEPGKPLSIYAVVRVKITDTTANIISGDKTYKPDASGWAEIEVPLTKPEEKFTIQVIAVTGDVREIPGTIMVPEFSQIHVIKPEKYTINVGIGPTYVVFREDQVAAFNQVAMTVKAGANYQFVGKAFDLGVAAYVNALPALTSNSGYIQMFGGNVRAGFLLPLPKLPKWKIRLLGGYYYVTTISSSGQFGFRNVSGVQIYPSAQFSIDDRKTISAYAKYAPFFGKTTLLSAGNFEAALGINYNFPVRLFKKTIDLSAGIDYSFLQFTDPSYKLLLSTYSASLSYLYHF